jgi:hypothetical protein
VIDRIRHFRAGLLLALASAVVFWPISYWFPLPEYLGVLASEEYANYQLALRSIVVIYFVFFLLNLVTAGLSATKFSSTVKFYLALVPAAVLLIAPFLLIIPTALSFRDRNYFEIFQAMYRLLRFTSPQLLGLALVCTAIAIALNVKAALVFRSAKDLGNVAPQVKKRYFIYGGVALLVFAIIVPLGAFNGAVRSQDRAACQEYAALRIPELDEEVPNFLSEIRVAGESAGSRSLRDSLIKFSDLSRQYFALVNTDDVGSFVLQEAEKETKSARDAVIQACSDYSVR